MPRLRVGSIVPVMTFLLSIAASLGTWPVMTLAFDLPAGISASDSLTTTEGAAGSAKSGADEPGYGVHLQIGALYRFAHSVDDGKLNHLLTADLSLVSWNRSHSTWGVGAHWAIDDLGHRFGVKGIWRTPLSSRGLKYLQVAPGIYLSSEDSSFEPKLPGYFLEVEVGVWREAAVLIAGEVLSYENRKVLWTSQPPPGAALYDSGTSTAFFAGVKLGQVWAIAAAAVAAVIVAIGTIEWSFGM